MLDIRPLAREEILARLDDLADLRIHVFRAYPYLYDGDRAYEATYLRPYAESARALVVGAFAGDRLVGASTAAPMEDHAEGFAEPLAAAGLAPETVWYCGESVLLPECRGQGAYPAFFRHREAAGRAHGRQWSVFCGVIRPEDHPLRPADYRPLDPVWRRFGYEKLDGATARFPWRDLSETEETEKPMAVWIKRLD
ncbi:MAG: GNAT family N-acetyltransferase [Pseudomonadota bacterium]